MMYFRYFIVCFFFCCFVSLSANEWPASMASGTLPVVYINTIDSQPIETKTNYIKGDLWIDPKSTDLERLASEEDPLEIEIRGRGNYTWNHYDKKPYKIKFDKKQSVFGLPKNKHWALLADANSHTIFTTVLAQEISRKVGLEWTPSAFPVEVVLNGEYIGFYTLCETIRVDENRVNITEQDDLETDPEKITGGWLMEITNTEEPFMVVMTDNNGRTVSISPDTPEELSEVQKIYIEEQMQTLHRLIHAEDKEDSSQLESILDFNALARFYLVCELIDDKEAFSGSCYFYKEKGEDEKWKFGPIWDLGNSMRKKNNERFYDSDNDGPNNFNNTWIQELIKFPALRSEIMKVWAEFVKNNDVEYFKEYMTSYIKNIETAYMGPENDRWPEYNIALSWYAKEFPARLEDNFRVVDAWYRTLPEFSIYSASIISEPDADTNTVVWQKEQVFDVQADCSYTARVDSLTSKFRIMSDDVDGSGFAIGQLNVETHDVEHKNIVLKIAEENSGFKLPYTLLNARLTYLPAKQIIAISYDDLIETPFVEITFSCDSLRLLPGQEASIDFSVNPEDTDLKNLIWRSDNDSIVQVNQSGVIRALRSGLAHVTVGMIDDNDTYASCLIAVDNPPADYGDEEAIILETLYLSNGASSDLTDYVVDTEISGWESENPDIVMVGDDGIVHSDQYGQTIVRGNDIFGRTIARFNIYVCPELIVATPKGILYGHHVLYNSRPTCFIFSADGYKIAGITHDGEPVNESVVTENGLYVSSKTIVENSVINLSIEESTNTQVSDGIFSDSNVRLYVNKMTLTVVGKAPDATVNIFDIRGQTVFSGSTDSTFTFDSPGVYVVSIEDRTFKIIII